MPNTLSIDTKQQKRESDANPHNKPFRIVCNDLKVNNTIK